MDADALLHPRGPLPPSVYWRRRLVTFGAVLVVLALLLRACGGGGGGSVTPAPSTSPTGGATGATGPRPTGPSGPTGHATTPAAQVGPCPDTAIVVSARADAQTYPASRRPILTISIANKGAVPCTRDVGQAAREIRVTSGNARIWSSDDCSPGGGSQVVTLLPGAAPLTFSVTWSRRRSAPDCPAGAELAEPGTYRVTGRFGEVLSTGDTFSLTG
ncbi:MAG TPA: hypothetical protein VGX28_01250 [Frankiaceae bacterium]|jgi:hypothetical protein|nr:hypothetical protein [Frankiaceae bacterium]